MSGWGPDELERIDAAEELEVATRRADGSLRRSVPIWVVRVGDAVLVRTWYRRETGWFGRAVASGEARVRVPGLELDVTVEDLGAGPSALRTEVDAAYEAKYGRYGAATTDRMVSDDAAAATLRLSPRR